MVFIASVEGLILGMEERSEAEVEGLYTAIQIIGRPPPYARGKLKCPDAKKS